MTFAPISPVRGQSSLNLGIPVHGSRSEYIDSRSPALRLHDLKKIDSADRLDIVP